MQTATQLRCRFEVSMEEFEFDVGGAPVVFSNKKTAPYNPLNRPKICFKKCILCLIGFAMLVIVSIFISKFIFCKWWHNYISLDEKYLVVIFTLIDSLIYCSIFLKRSLIWFVHLYQHYAPDRIRLKCVFEPSCSEYMILSIEKYGAIKGLIKGCIRLLRCHPPNGGRDEP